MSHFTLPLFLEKDCKPEMLRGKIVALIGYGSQGRSHALNLRDSGVQVVVGLRADSASRRMAEQEGFTVLVPSAAAARGDVVMLLTPDEIQGDVYRDHLHGNLKKNAALGFAHGLAIHYGLIKPRADLDIFMAAPKAIGPAVRSEYLAGRGVPGLIAVHQDISGKTKDIVLAYMAGLGCARAGIFEATFAQECEADLFSEQAILCGGMSALIRAGYETLVEAGFPPELAYFECLHEMKLVADLIYASGISGMRDAISNTAEFGAYRGEARIVPPAIKEEMKKILREIQSGQVVQEFLGGNKEGLAGLPALREKSEAHEIENVGAKLRALIFPLPKGEGGEAG